MHKNINISGNRTTLPIRHKSNPCPIRVLYLLSLLFGLISPITSHGQVSRAYILYGQVLTEDNGIKRPLPNVTVSIKGKESTERTDQDGSFTIVSKEESGMILFASLGFESQEIKFNLETNNFTIFLLPMSTEIEDVEVLRTGYYELPKERSTGSFSRIDPTEYRKRINFNVLEGMEGLSTALNFDRRASGTTGSGFQMQVRGLNTIHSDQQPLIVLDNFPYEGNISDINPNDVKDIVILKDAAAASIWGAKAANGVIVITTKRGEQVSRIDLTVNQRWVEKPDLYYSPNFIPSSDFIEIERLLFDRGFYNAMENNLAMPSLSPAVEMFIKHRDGQISSSELGTWIESQGHLDIRDGASRYLYRNGYHQQYALSLSGGRETASYLLSFGYDQDNTSLQMNSNNRVTLLSKNSLRINDRIDLTATLNYASRRLTSDGIHLSQIRPNGFNIYPYARLADEYGTPLAIDYNHRGAYVDEAMAEGLLDWRYIPLHDRNLNQERRTENRMSIDLGGTLKLIDRLNLDVKYQYFNSPEEGQYLRGQDSYYVRDMINRFTGEDLSSPFPSGAILTRSRRSLSGHTGRTQLNFDRTMDRHNIYAIAGAEIREVVSKFDSYQLYGYNDEVLTHNNTLNYQMFYPTRPRGTSRIPVPGSSLMYLTDRFLSYYANMAYSLYEKYNLTGSIRWDASNLFGVKTNQKGVPLWSVGGSWSVHKESSLNLSETFSELKLRLTYGFNGNVNNNTTAYTTLSYFNDYITNLRNATVVSPGNPQLRWERVGTWNAGLDFGILGNRLKGSLDVYRKNATDMLGQVNLDPTAGFSGIYRLNSANMTTRGIDMELYGTPIDRRFKWHTTLFLSYSKDEITYHDDVNVRPTDLYSSWINAYPIVGYPLYRIYSFPWYGLDPDSGDPLVPGDDGLGTNYRDYIANFSIEDFRYHGSAIPTYFGSVRNTFSWEDINLSFNVQWKAGYYFRRDGLSYSALFNSNVGHREFADRWKSPGDEHATNIPSIPNSVDSQRDAVYRMSEILVERGDHIRLQEIQLGYNWKQKIHFQANANNIGFIWRANKYRLDPDMPNTLFPLPLTISVGAKVSF